MAEHEEGVPDEEAREHGCRDGAAMFQYWTHLANAVEDLTSDEGDDTEEDGGDDDGDDDNEAKQMRILEETTGMPRAAFDGGKKQHTEPPLQPGDGDGPVTIDDLLDDIRDKPGYSKVRKMLRRQQEKRPVPVQPPLASAQRALLARRAAYGVAKKDIGKWACTVKRNREAPTLYFENDLNLGVNTVGAIASKFEPRTPFEKQMAGAISRADIMEAHRDDGAKILELNKMDVEDVRERQDRLAKMRNLLFRHEMKAKCVKKIKSRTYHQLSKTDKLKAFSADLEADPEAAKESARNLEFKRAEERMTLKHMNNSKWAKRIVKRGLSAQDEGTRDAITAQLQQHALLTRKMNSVEDDSSSSDESSDGDDDEDESKLGAEILNRGKEKILREIEEDNEIPKTGVFSLPFMERAMKKRADATYDETWLDYEELEESLRKLEDDNTEGNVDLMKVTGKRNFGPVKRAHKEANMRAKLGDARTNSYSEYDSDSGQYYNSSEVNKKADDVQLGTALLGDEQPNDLFIIKSSKANDGKNWKESSNKSKVQTPSVDPNPKLHNSDSDSEEEMVDGFLTISDGKENYEHSSQADLIRQAFACDDVEAEFEKDKVEALNEENPEPEEPALIPGWGQWTCVQCKRGLPSRMARKHEDAKREREKALAGRKDAHLEHVIISEHVDKAEKLLAPNLPFPYTSNDVYENIIRMPLGPDFNPTISAYALNRPAIVKKPGVVIKPIQYGETDPYEKPNEPRRIIQRVNRNPKAKKTSVKPAKRTTSNQRNRKMSKRNKTLNSFFQVRTTGTAETGPSTQTTDNIPSVTAKLKPGDVESDPGKRIPIEDLDADIRDLARTEQNG